MIFTAARTPTRTISSVLLRGPSHASSRVHERNHSNHKANHRQVKIGNKFEAAHPLIGAKRVFCSIVPGRISLGPANDRSHALVGRPRESLTREALSHFLFDSKIESSAMKSLPAGESLAISCCAHLDCQWGTIRSDFDIACVKFVADGLRPECVAARRHWPVEDKSALGIRAPPRQ